MKKFILILCIYFGFVCFLLAEEKFPFIGEVTAKNLNIRAGYNINFEIVHKLEQSQKVEVLDKKFDWYKIRLPQEANCFISAKYIKKQNKPYAEVTGQRVNVRARPDIKSSVICQVNKGDTVKIVEKINPDWYKISALQDCCGWVYDKYVKYYSTQEQYRKEQGKVMDEATEEIEVVSEGLASGEEFDFQQIGTVRRLTSFFPHPATHELIQNGKTICYLLGDKSKLNSFISAKVKIVGNLKKELNYSHPVVLVEKILIEE